MSIPPAVLERWAGYPGPARSVAAHVKVRGALEIVFRTAGIDVDVYLQGSYRNHVNTKGDSDVDVVAELTSVCEFDTRHLTPWEAQRFWGDIQYSTYGYDGFRTDVKNGLDRAFGNAVVEHKKAIEVRGSLTRMKVDVLPAVGYHQVLSYNATNYSSHRGIAFWVDSRRVVNWPQHHFDNGVSKNQATNGTFKPTVRMFKNARSAAVERGLLEEGLAPSYFLQALIWNVPNECFVRDLCSTYWNAVDWLCRNQAAHNWFLCQNGIDPMFGATPEQWTMVSAFQLEAAFGSLWNNWQ